MPEPFNYENQPEFAGPMTEPRAQGGVMLDVQALAQGTVRLPQLDPAAQARGELAARIDAEAMMSYKRPREAIERERAELYERDLLTLEIAQAARRGIRNAIDARNATAAAISDADETARLVAHDELAAADDEPKEAAK